MMDGNDAALVSASYARVATRGAALTIAFFTRMHETLPRLRHLFPFDDLEKRAVAKELFDLVVGHLSSKSELAELLERMGRRGLLDRVDGKEVAELGVCLVQTLAYFDDGWTSETKEAWESVYTWAVAAAARGARVRRRAH